MLLADYFLDVFKQKGFEPKINRERVFQLLLYHDVVEIETGDISIHLEDAREGKEEKEKLAIQKLSKEVPKELEEKLIEMFYEYENHKTIEAKFAKAIDVLDAQIHEIDYKNDWIGWTADILYKHKKNKVKEFPILDEFFEELIDFLKKDGYFDQ
ncbi:HD domain-containing protein [Candidatus Micrarchaeota archaeon]|nr:HD domain-containing protein [Candidatus Micrarchaeota archaeon]